MRAFFVGGTILTPYETIREKTLVIEDGQITGIEPELKLDLRNGTVIDAANCWIIPGMIDLHVHGAMGFDTMDASLTALRSMGEFFARHGVTGYLPTTMSMPAEAILRAINNVTHCPQPEAGAHHLGIHLEGPYLNSEFRGAQSIKYLRNSNQSEYESWFDPQVVKLVTIAPEVEGVKQLITDGIQKGIEFSVGHSGASYDQVIEAADLGLKQATHTFNGMARLHHRNPGVVGAVLTDERIFAQVIADGVHVHPAIIKMLVQLKGVERTILITDAVQATGLNDGKYTLGSEDIHVRGCIPRTSSGNLAGSTLTMDRALRNTMQFTGLTLFDVLPMCTSVPAKAMGWNAEKGNLEIGADADVVLLDQNLRVCLTMVAGKVVYQNFPD